MSFKCCMPNSCSTAPEGFTCWYYKLTGKIIVFVVGVEAFLSQTNYLGGCVHGNHRNIEQFGLERTFKGHPVQPLCSCF